MNCQRNISLPKKASALLILAAFECDKRAIHRKGIPGDMRAVPHAFVSFPFFVLLHVFLCETRRAQQTLRLGAHQATATGWARLSGCDCMSVGWEDTLTTRLDGIQGPETS